MSVTEYEQQLVALREDLLRYARNEQAEMQREAVDLGPLVTDTAEEFRSPAATR